MSFRRVNPETDLAVEQRKDSWYHICNMSLSPFVPFLRRMHFLYEDVEHEEIHLKVGVVCLVCVIVGWA